MRAVVRFVQVGIFLAIVTYMWPSIARWLDTMPSLWADAVSRESVELRIDSIERTVLSTSGGDPKPVVFARLTLTRRDGEPDQEATADGSN